VAFDLDGTLIHSVPDLAQAVDTVLRELRMAPLAEGSVAQLIGNGFEALLERAFALSMGRAATDAEIDDARERFMRAYSERVFDRSSIYPAVLQTLDELAATGLRIGCITNKSGRFALPLLEAAGLRERFDVVLSPQTASERKPSPLLLQRALAFWAIAPEQLLYVGDSHVDIGAARAAGTRVALVSYGYGRARHDQPPDWTVDSLSELRELR
jgi:phosphoglycolate phosphatase